VINLLLGLFIFPVSYFFPKDERLWCFGAWFGKQYADNSKFLYEEMASGHYGVRCVWITKSKKINDDLRLRGLESYYYLSIKGIYLQLRSKVFILSVNSFDVLFGVTTPNNTIIQLWHGSPLKKIGFDVADLTKKRQFIQWLRHKTTDSYSYLVSPSLSFDEIFSSAFRLPKSSIIRNGYPRCDGFFIDSRRKSRIKAELNAKGKKLVVYMPTHRGENSDGSFINGEVQKFVGISDYLNNNNMKVIIKPHFYEYKNITNYISDEVEVYDLSADLDIYEVLGAADILITDYSSIFIDYQMLGKKIIFYAPDLEDYLINQRGMYFDYCELISNYCVDIKSLVKSLSDEKQNNGLFNIILNDDCLGGFSSKLANKLMDLIYDTK